MRTSGGTRILRHLARRAKARGADIGERIAVRVAPMRASTRKIRKVARRCRPEADLRPDYLPLAIH